MASTYTPIATYTADGTSQSVTFSSVPSTYTDIIVVSSIRSTTSGATDAVQIQLNGTGSIYSDTDLKGDGSSATSFRNTNPYGLICGNCPAASATSGVYGTVISHIMNYANTTTYKTVLNRSGSPSDTFATVGLARTTSAINNIIVFTASANMASGSVITLYGIKAA